MHHVHLDLAVACGLRPLGAESRVWQRLEMGLGLELGPGSSPGPAPSRRTGRPSAVHARAWVKTLLSMAGSSFVSLLRLNSCSRFILFDLFY